MKLNKIFLTIALTALSTATATQAIATQAIELESYNDRDTYTSSRDKIIPIFNACGGSEKPPCR
ncbi:MAG: hypothetical protein QNJ65_19650 [Xenococcaceae cyanobacterium MO_234.B1]|nr:hypothetical protein [Xenococcaceae cyanobacterium MO_234.B1]